MFLFPMIGKSGRKICGKGERKILSRNEAASVSLVLSTPELAEEHLLL